MRVVYKYPFPMNETFVLEMPQAHHVVHVDMQGQQSTLWAEVDTDFESYAFNFIIAGTNHAIPKDGGYFHVGTFMMAPFVWHLYEERGCRMDVRQ